MRKLLISFTIALLIIPTITFAQGGKAETARAALNATLTPSIDAPQAKSAVPQTGEAAVTYNWYTIFNYQASTGYWWTGLAITNGLNSNSLMVRLVDSGGTLRGEGTFSLSNFNQQRIAGLDDMIGTGYVPSVGSIYLYGTKYFTTTMFVGIGDVGFGFIEKEASSF